MARGESKRKMGYYRTPPSIVRLIVSNISWTDGAAICDPFAGYGLSMKEMAEQSGVDCSTRGNELNVERYSGLCGNVDNALTGAAEFLDLQEPDSGFSVLLYNPPYDKVLNERLENKYIEIATRLLAPGGVLVAVIPEKVAKGWTWLYGLIADYVHIATRRFPQPEYERFKQAVVFAVKRDEQPYDAASYVKRLENELKYDMPQLAASEFNINLPAVNSPGMISNMPLPAETLAAVEQQTLLKSKMWRKITQPERGSVFRPLQDPQPGHVAQLLAAGMLDGAEIEGNILKGYNYKYLETDEKTRLDSSGNSEVVYISTERLASVIVSLDKESGEITAYDSHKNTQDYERFLDANLDDLMRAVKNRYQPIFDGEISKFEELFASIHAPGKLPGYENNDGLLDAQKQTAAAIATLFNNGEKGVVLVGDMGVGKAAPLDSLLLTPAGWKEMGSIQSGDQVIGKAGLPVTVTGVFPQGIKKIYKTTFSDGATAETCGEHLWRVAIDDETDPGCRDDVLTLKQIMNGIERSGGKRRFYIPLVTPVTFEDSDVISDPYQQGMLVGQANYWFDLVEKIATSKVRNLAIPEEYKLSSIVARLAVLQGLLDSNVVAHESAAHTISMSCTSAQLARDMVFLVQSLGGLAAADEDENRKNKWRVTLSLPGSLRPFRNSPVARQYKPNKRFKPGRYIDKIEYVGMKAAQCISVDAPDQLYVTSDFVVTHNTLVSQSIIALITTAAAAVVASNQSKTVVLVPDHLIHKWKREIERSLRNFNARGFICKDIADVDSAFAYAGMSFLILGQQAAKNDAIWRPVTNSRDKKQIVEVATQTPKASHPYSEEAVVNVVRSVTAHYCPTCGYELNEDQVLRVEEMKSGSTWRHQEFCWNCQHALWQEQPFKTKGNNIRYMSGDGFKAIHKALVVPETHTARGRRALARYINRKYPNRYFLIVDEAHQTKGKTNIGFATQWLTTAARKVLYMTGTLYGGKASSIFNLAYRCFPHFRNMYAWDGEEDFIDHYGLRRVISDRKAEYESSTFGYKRLVGGRSNATEVPGTSPLMVSMLLTHTAFLYIEDVAPFLPSFNEYKLGVQPVDGDAAWEIYNSTIMGSLRDAAMSQRAKGNLSLLGQWQQAALGYLDCPKEEEFTDGDEIIAVPSAAGHNPVKSETLVDLILAEHAAGRKTMVFFQQVNRRDPMPLIAGLLDELNIRYSILRKHEHLSLLPGGKSVKVKHDEREEFVARAVKRGAVVLMCSPDLVQTGLDLIDFPNIVYFGIDYNLAKLRQSSRRSWRLGQEHPVKVIFMYWKKSKQQEALVYMATKYRAANLVDGRSIDGLAAMGGNTSFIEDLVNRATGVIEPDLPDYEFPASQPVRIDKNLTAALDIDPLLETDTTENNPEGKDSEIRYVVDDERGGQLTFIFDE